MRLKDLFPVVLEVYSPENSRFRRYMANPDNFDYYQHWWEICKWLEDNDYLPLMSELISAAKGTPVEIADQHELNDEYEPEVFELLPDEIQQECADGVYEYMQRHNAADLPTHQHASLQSTKRIIPRTTWLVHFSDHAPDIARNGFTHGEHDMARLGLTTWTKHEGKKYGGYNFAFEVPSRHASWSATQSSNGKGYGKHAVMFQNSGVKIHHYGDEEDQVVFWGKDVSPANIVLLYNDGGDWQVRTSYGKRDVLFTGTFDKAANWVIQNYQQYRGVL